MSALDVTHLLGERGGRLPHVGYTWQAYCAILLYKLATHDKVLSNK
jgi:hypothetical protein